MESLWKSTKGVTTRTKTGQMPRLLLKINYKEAGEFIGDLDNKVSLESYTASEMEIRSFHDYRLDLSKIIAAMKTKQEKIASVEFMVDPEFREILEIESSWTEMKLD